MDRKTIILFAISILILALMLWYVGVDDVIDSLKIANLYIIGLAILLQIFTYVMYSLRWEILNVHVGMDVSVRNLLPIVIVGLAVNNITPSGRGGGEPVRAYILDQEYGYKFEDTFATVVADRAMDTFPFIVLAIITIISMTLFVNMPSWLLVAMIVAVIAIVAILIILVYMCVNLNFGKRVDGWIVGLLRRFYKKNTPELEEKVHRSVFGFQDTMRTVISNKKVLAITVPLSFFIWMLEIFRVYLVFLAFGAPISVIVIGEVFIVASLVGMIPLLPGGIGAIDGIMILFYSNAGVSPSISAAATVIERLISYWMATILGLLILPRYGASILDKLSPSSDDSEEKSQ